MVKLPFLKITYPGISILRKVSLQRRILLTKTYYEQQTTQNTYQMVKVLETSIFGYISEQ